MDETVVEILGHINAHPGIPLDKLRIAVKDIPHEELDAILQDCVQSERVQEIPASELYEFPRYYPTWMRLPRELPSDDVEPAPEPEPKPRKTMPQIYLGKTGDTDIIEIRIKEALKRFEAAGEKFTARQVLDKAGYSMTALQRRPHLRTEISIASTKIVQAKAKAKAAARLQQKAAVPLFTKNQAVVAVTRDFSRHVEIMQVRALRDHFGLVMKEVRAERKTVLVHRNGQLVAGLISLRMLEAMNIEEEPLTLPIGNVASLFRIIWESLETRDAVVISRYNQPAVVFVAPRLLK